jgi:hypothetical protein
MRWPGVYFWGDEASIEGAVVSGAAHCPQKANPCGLSKPHCGQRRPSGLAHWPQNFMPSGFSKPQLGQRIGAVLRKNRCMGEICTHQPQKITSIPYRENSGSVVTTGMWCIWAAAIIIRSHGSA